MQACHIEQLPMALKISAARARDISMGSLVIALPAGRLQLNVMKKP